MTVADRLEQTRKFLLILGTFGVAVWTVLEFSASARIEARKPFLQKQLTLCFEAVTQVSTLATTTDPAKWQEAKGRFLELYWGELAVVENKAVAGKMQDFKRELSFATENDLPITKDDLPIKDLVVPSIRIAHECRALIKENWSVPSLIELSEDLFK